MSKALSSLVVGEHVVSRSETGLLGAEYALFDRSDVLLSGAAVGHGVQELGYVTTAGAARARLRQAGLTSDLAHEAFDALRDRGHLRGLARNETIREVIGQIGPLEAFEGGVFLSEEGVYAGTWLDLRALARACASREAPLIVQALHLLLVVEEVDEDAPVRLLTADSTHTGPSGQRTWRSVSLKSADRLPGWLRATTTALRDVDSRTDEAEVREEILRHLKARSTSSSLSQPRLYALASRFARTGTPPPGALSSSLLEELRNHADLLRGGAHVRAVAQFLSAMADRTASAPELAMLAARAWLAAGEQGHARHFARLLVEDGSVDDDVRLAALEILESTPSTNESSFPPPVQVIQPAPVIVIAPTEPDRPAPVGASLPPMAPEPVPDTVRIPRTTPPAMAAPLRVPPGRGGIVETLALPDGLTEDMLPAGAPVRNAAHARIAMTRLARELGRDYRIWYGTTLSTNLVALDAMQRHLRRRFPDPPSDEKHARQLEAELLRHGALLSEILARTLGAEWIEEGFASEPPGHWAMLLRPDLRIWPIGRVHRFFRQGHREADLVAYYGELEAHVRSQGGVH